MNSLAFNPHTPMPALKQLGEGQAEPFQVSKSKRDCLIDLDPQSNRLSQELDAFNLSPEEVTQIIQVLNLRKNNTEKKP